MGIPVSRWWIALWWEAPEPIRPWVDFLSAYTPQIYVRSEQSLVFEIGRSRALIDEAGLKIKLVDFLEASKVGNEIPTAMDGHLTLPLMGGAQTPPEALCRARYQIAHKQDLPMEALRYFLEPFCESMDSLRSLKKLINDLKSLGLTRIGSFLDFSEREVGMRWSHWGQRLWLTVHGCLPLQEPRILTTEVFEESYEFPEDSVGTQLEPLYFLSKQLLQRLHVRLNAKNLGARSLKVTLTGVTYEEDFSGSVEFYVTLPAFHHEVNLWLHLLREKLQSLAQQQKLPELLESLSLCVDETLEWNGLQRDLLDPQREHREGALLESLSKLEARLGKEKVFMAAASESYRPEQSWERSPSSDWYKRTVTLGQRSVPDKDKIEVIYKELSDKPLRVFPEAQKLLFRDKYVLFANQWELCRLVWCEIVCGEFWCEPFERRYGFAYLKGGEKLWVFKEGDEIYLQGIY